MKTHTEQIKCPQCGDIQTGTVEHTEPWYTYIHICTKCRYVIMENDWNKIETK